MKSSTSEIGEIARAKRLCRPLCDTLDMVRADPEVRKLLSGVKLPQNIDRFDPSTELHVALAWCLNLRERRDLDQRERSFRISAIIAHGGVIFTGKDKPVQKVRDIFTTLWIYKSRWEEKSLPRYERLKSLDPVEMNLTHVRQLLTWVQLRLANLQSLEEEAGAEQVQETHVEAKTVDRSERLRAA